MSDTAINLWSEKMRHQRAAELVQLKRVAAGLRAAIRATQILGDGTAKDEPAKPIRPSPLDCLQRVAAGLNGEWLSDRDIIARLDVLSAPRKFKPKYLARVIRREVGTLFEIRRGNSRVHPSVFRAIHNQKQKG